VVAAIEFARREQGTGGYRDGSRPSPRRTTARRCGDQGTEGGRATAAAARRNRLVRLRRHQVKPSVSAGSQLLGLNRAFARHQLAERPGPARRAGSKLRRSRSRRQGERGHARRSATVGGGCAGCALPPTRSTRDEPAVRVARNGGRRRTVRPWRLDAQARADARRSRLRRRLRGRVRPALSAHARGRREGPLPAPFAPPPEHAARRGYVPRRTVSRAAFGAESRTNVSAEEDLRVCRRPGARCKRR
jgi:hypothetical protein